MMPADTWQAELTWLLQAAMLVFVMMVVIGTLTS